MPQFDDKDLPNLAELALDAVSNWKIGLYQHNHSTGEFHASRLVQKLYDFSSGESLTLEKLGQNTFPADLEMLKEAIIAAHDPTGNGKLDLCYRIILNSGETRWVHTRSQTTFAKIGGVQCPIITKGSVIDETQQKELEISLIRKEASLSRAIDVAQIGIAEHDHLAGEIVWGTKFREILGVDANQAASIDWFMSSIPEEEVERVKAIFTQSHDPAGDGFYDIEHRWIHPDGKARWFLTRGITLFENVHGLTVPAHTISAVIDVTKYREIEADQQRHSDILEATPDFVSITDRHGNFIYLNRAGRNLLNYSEGEVATHGMKDIHTKNSSRLILEEALPMAIKTGTWKGETEFLDCEGTTIPMSMVLLSHKNTDGEIAYLSIIARNLSREKALEEQFHQSQKLEAIGRLAGGIAHDFNNMLSVIMGFTSLAIDKLPLQNEIHKELTEVLNASNKAAALTEHLLAFSRKQILQLKVIDINATLMSMKPMIERVIDESIQLTLSLCDEGTCIEADQSQLEQMFLNLFVNARDAMITGGELSITTRQIFLNDNEQMRKLDLSSGAYIQITVSDTGHGMSTETKEQMFEPFFTTKEIDQGTGLGLATVFGIVKQSGGSILVDSELGQGTHFKLFFPTTDDCPTPIEKPVPIVHQRAQGVILIAEDEPQLRAMASTSLKNAGYTVLSAGSGKEALDIAKRYNGDFDLLLTDVVMPKMSGKQLADELLKSRPNTQVLYMSGYTEHSIVHHGVLDTGINFLPKPVTPQKLLTAISKVLSVPVP